MATTTTTTTTTTASSPAGTAFLSTTSKRMIHYNNNAGNNNNHQRRRRRRRNQLQKQHENDKNSAAIIRSFLPLCSSNVNKRTTKRRSTKKLLQLHAIVSRGGGSGNSYNYKVNDIDDSDDSDNDNDNDDVGMDTIDKNELPLDYPRRREVLVALAAVREACRVTQKLQPNSSSSSPSSSSSSSSSPSGSSQEPYFWQQKWDQSPVTVGDFSAQAIVLHYLQHAFSSTSHCSSSDDDDDNNNDYNFIAEESSNALVQLQQEDDKDTTTTTTTKTTKTTGIIPSPLGRAVWNATSEYFIKHAKNANANRANKNHTTPSDDDDDDDDDNNYHDDNDDLSSLFSLCLKSIDLGQSYHQQTPNNNNNNNNNNNTYCASNNNNNTSHFKQGNFFLNPDEKKNNKTTKTWTLDPIDGTKGFLRGRQNGGQYCVALALLEDGIPTIGILGCPNLPSTHDDDDHDNVDDDGVNNHPYAWRHNNNETNQSRGCIFVASKGGGAYQLPLFPSKTTTTTTTANVFTSSPHIKRIRVKSPEEMKPHEARFCVGMEKSFSDPLGQFDAIMAEMLHGGNETNDQVVLNSSSGGGGENTEEQQQLCRRRRRRSTARILRMDSQAKYGVLGRGEADIFLRLPRPDYQEWIWDICAGAVVIQEAGGQVTDTEGNELDFSQSLETAKLLPANNSSSRSGGGGGILVSNGGTIHRTLVAAYQRQAKEREKARAAAAAVPREKENKSEAADR